MKRIKQIFVIVVFLILALGGAFYAYNNFNNSSIGSDVLNRIKDAIRDDSGVRTAIDGLQEWSTGIQEQLNDIEGTAEKLDAGIRESTGTIENIRTSFERLEYYNNRASEEISELDRILYDLERADPYFGSGPEGLPDKGGGDGDRGS